MTTRSLALAADNTRPAPGACQWCRAGRLGYREALAAGVCQRCHRASPGVRTAGMRRPDQLHFRRLALCPACLEAGRAQGYPVMS